MKNGEPPLMCKTYLEVRSLIFMLSTRAGSPGIHPATVHIVVLFDCDKNSQVSLQAMVRSTYSKKKISAMCFSTDQCNRVD